MRALVAWILPALATFAAWWVFLGVDDDGQYTVGQVAGTVLLLLVVGIVGGWFARNTDLLAVIVSAVVGVSFACWTSWAPDDDSGLFIVGWLLVTAGMVIGASVVVIGTWAVRRRLHSDRGSAA